MPAVRSGQDPADQDKEAEMIRKIYAALPPDLAMKAADFSSRCRRGMPSRRRHTDATNGPVACSEVRSYQPPFAWRQSIGPTSLRWERPPGLHRFDEEPLHIRFKGALGWGLAAATQLLAVGQSR